MIGGISYFHEFAYDLLAENERILASTFDAAIAAHRDGHLERIIVVSSSMVYESATVFPTPEGAQLHARRRRSRPTASRSSPRSTSPRAPGSSTSSRTRSSARSTASGSASAGRSATRDIMCGNVKLALSHVVPDLVLKVLKGQDPLHILGDGNQVRHYTYGGDLAHGIRLAMESPTAVNEDFNLSTAASTTVLELAELIWRKIHGPDRAVPLRLRPAVRARRPAARARRAQGPRGPRLRGDDDARHDARRGHPVDPRRGRRPAGCDPRRCPSCTTRASMSARSARRIAVWREIVALPRTLRSTRTRPSSTSPAIVGTSSGGVGASERWATDIRDVRPICRRTSGSSRRSGLDLVRRTSRRATSARCS